MIAVDTDVCLIKGCYRERRARGFCSAHYARLNRGLAMDVPIRADTRDRIVDLLESDGGWLTKYAVAEMLGLKVNTAQKALCKLRRTGLVVSRPAPWCEHPTINEWRLSW